MSSVIAVENLSKKYIITHQKQMGPTTLRDTLSNSARRFSRTLLHPLVGPPKNDSAHEDFWALKDVSFDIQQGDRVGIIGGNGAGKSTLLKLLSRITEPSSGQIRIHGRVSSLLEVGTGFHPELSGRENIYLNGAILGMTKSEIRRKFDEIVAFAEIEKFLDTPVKRYSSGMYVRLAFAVAAHLEPEILIVDEVLAVGDAQFQKKCLGKMENIGEDGRTVLFVSHNISAIRTLCNTGILLNKGKLAFNGGIDEAIDEYLWADRLDKNEAHWDDITKAPGNENVRLLSISSKAHTGEILNIDSGVQIEIRFYNAITNENLDATMHLLTIEGVYVLASGIPISLNKDSQEGFYTATVKIPPYFLNAGVYKVTLLFGRDQLYAVCKIDDILTFEIQNSTAQGNIKTRSPGVVKPALSWSLARTALGAPSKIATPPL